MAFLTPYVVDGAQHSARLFRRQLQLASSGAAGVGLTGDLKVSALNVPGDGFRVAAGGVLIPSRDAGAGRETYGVENDAQITVSGVAGTGSGAGRTDMVIVEVMDPSMSAVTYPVPPDPLVAAYTRVRVVQGVSATAKTVADVPSLNNVTAYALALIKWPASTGTITNAMITDLRGVSNPRVENVLRTFALVQGDEDSLNITDPAGEIWPNSAMDAWGNVFVPEWANRMRVHLVWYGVKSPHGNAYGHVWFRLGTGAGAITTQTTRWDLPNISDVTRETFGVADDRAVPSEMRGSYQRMAPMGRLLSSVTANAPIADAATSMVLQLEFYEATL